VLRASGLPYPASLPTLRLAAKSLSAQTGLKSRVTKIVSNRERLRASLGAFELTTSASEGNFLLVRGVDSRWWRDALAALGIAVRVWPQREGLTDAVRISVPIEQAIATIASPQALLFDLDGVLADVSRSYRQAVVKTASEFGVSLSMEQIEEAKAQGDANNDWVLTQRLLEQAGQRVSLARVTSIFEAHYQGRQGKPGLCTQESLIGQRTSLACLSEQTKLAVVTGRPRRDATTFLERFGLETLFDAVVTMEDAPAKPSPAPVVLAMSQLGVERAWMLGDTPDDVIAARGAGVLPLGVRAPGSEEATLSDALVEAGAAAVFDDWQSIQGVWR
jgi:HAD superfamily hydrolase (TIGR01548 family)